MAGTNDKIPCIRSHVIDAMRNNSTFRKRLEIVVECLGSFLAEHFTTTLEIVNHFFLLRVNAVHRDSVFKASLDNIVYFLKTVRPWPLRS